jgi:phosphatidylserine/phosphatidylglycerophosphate/cardiolipin synthase-like enzyme
MHNKFLVGCDYLEACSGSFLVVPKQVWTGSYNFSYNARASFENALIISDTEIAMAYAQEWAQIYALSEPLDWQKDWVAPEYRIGT